MTFNFYTFDWVSLSAIGTFFAVAVALFYPLWHERRRIRFYGHIGYILPSEPGKPKIILNLTNLGLKPIKIINWGGKCKRKFIKEGKRNFINLEATNLGLIPKMLNYSDELTMWASSFDINLDKVKNLYCVDSTGKIWKLPLKYLRRMRKQVNDLPPNEFQQFLLL